MLKASFHCLRRSIPQSPWMAAFEKWCGENHLLLNVAKTEEIVVGFRKKGRRRRPLLTLSASVGVTRRP